MNHPFWYNDPSILLSPNIWPFDNMNFDEKLNAISRLVLLLSILGFLFTFNIKYILIGIVTFILIFIVYKMNKNKIIKNLINSKEAFTNGIINKKENYTTNPITLEKVLKNEFYPTKKKNPLGNVLLTEINSDPNRLAAAPSFNPDVYEDIMKQSKKTVQFLNPGIKNTNKQLFGDLADNFDFEWSMWNFFSTPNTRVTNDQGAYAQYLYGNMPSCKDGDGMACVQDNLRYILI
jgi:hypothetical protein